MEFQFHIDHMVLLVKIKILEEFLKVKKWLEEWVAKKVTKQNLKIIEIDEKNNILVVKGSVPGKKNSIIFLKDSIKKK